MQFLILLAVMFAGTNFWWPSKSQVETFHPQAVDKCLESSQLGDRISVLTSFNPYYLRGDFDGDGRPDYALNVRSTKVDRIGVLVCLGIGKSLLLGVEGLPFSDMPEDRFVAPNWEVFTKSETLDLRKYKLAVPRRIPHPKGETIAMIWEDGIGLIYWDGSAFKWIGSEP